MSDEEAIGAVGPDRRTFVRRLVVGAVFAAPVVSSFTMSGVGAISGDSKGSTTAAVNPNAGTPPGAPPNYPTNIQCFSVLPAGLDVTVPDGAVTLHLVVPAGALPTNSSVCIYRADLSSLTSIVPAGTTPVSGYAVLWDVPGGGSPNALSPITLTVTDPSVGPGDKIFVLDSGSPVGDGTTSGGVWVVTFTVDPRFVVTHASAAAAVTSTPAVTG